jgi:plasmid stabilization system protein ParE
MNIRLSAEARGDLRAVWEYSRSNWGLPQADLYLDQILLRMGWLPSNPGLWRPRPELGKGVHSYQEQRHVIFFRKTGRVLVISRLLHHGVDPSHAIFGGLGSE